MANLENQIIQQKLQNNNESILYIQTNIEGRPFLLNGNFITNGYRNSFLKIFNKNTIIGNSIMDVGSYFKYKTEIGTIGVGLVKFKYDALKTIDIAKFKIGDCALVKNYRYYTKLTNNVCLMGNQYFKDVKFMKLTKVIKENKVYPNILGIPNQIGFLNITIPLMFAIIIFLFTLGFWFFKRKFSFGKF